LKFIYKIIVHRSHCICSEFFVENSSFSLAGIVVGVKTLNLALHEEHIGVVLLAASARLDDGFRVVPFQLEKLI
jgi:hypothetical protein